MEPNQSLEHTSKNTFYDTFTLIRNGFILTLFTFDFMSWGYLIPFIGLMLIIYGCHLIKSQNSYLEKTYQLSLCQLLLLLSKFFFDCSSFFTNSLLQTFTVCMSCILTCYFIYCLDIGIFLSCLQCGSATNKHSLWIYIFLYLLHTFSSSYLININALGGLISIILLVINLIYFLYITNRITQELSLSNIWVDLVPFPRAKKVLFVTCTVLYIISLVAIVRLSNIDYFAKSYPLVQTGNNSTFTTLKENLIDIGVSREIADEIPSFELSYYKDVISATQQTEIFEYDDAQLTLTIFNFCLSNNQSRILCFYQWTGNPNHCFYDAIECHFPGYYQSDTFTGTFFYDDIDTKTTYLIPYTSYGLNKNNNMYGKMSIPTNGTNYRGYIAFSTTEYITKSNYCSLYYYHQQSILNLPYSDVISYMENYNSFQYSTIFDRKEVILKN